MREKGRERKGADGCAAWAVLRTSAFFASSTAAICRLALSASTPLICTVGRAATGYMVQEFVGLPNYPGYTPNPVEACSSACSSFYGLPTTRAARHDRASRQHLARSSRCARVPLRGVGRSPVGARFSHPLLASRRAILALAIIAC